jgi:hypothetical protein
MTTPELLFDAALPPAQRVRRAAALTLRAASRALDALAARLALVPQRLADEPVIEFHGDAAAPEGALYVDGQFVGRLIGVNRL